MFKFILLSMLMMQDLSTNKRLIIIFTKDETLSIYQKQISLFNADKNGLIERDIVLKHVIYDKSTAHLFKKNNVSGDFSIILIGKDGGEKFRSIKLTTIQQLYNIIDAMPMRRSEMKSKR